MQTLSYILFSFLSIVLMQTVPNKSDKKSHKNLVNAKTTISLTVKLLLSLKIPNCDNKNKGSLVNILANNYFIKLTIVHLIQIIAYIF